jgi:hypothetical protein
LGIIGSEQLKVQSYKTAEVRDELEFAYDYIRRVEEGCCFWDKVVNFAAGDLLGRIGQFYGGR